MTAAVASNTMSRFEPTPPSQLPADLKPYGEQWDQFLSKLVRVQRKDIDCFQWKLENGAAIGPYPVLIASKAVGKAYQDLFMEMQKLSGVPDDAKCAAILPMAVANKCPFGVYSFVNDAKNACDFSEDQVKDLSVGKKPAGLSEAASVTWDAANYLANTKGPLPERLYKPMVDVLGQEGALGVIHYAAFYSAIFVLQNYADVPLPPGVESF